jgi:hypothetical protein
MPCFRSYDEIWGRTNRPITHTHPCSIPVAPQTSTTGRVMRHTGRRTGTARADRATANPNGTAGVSGAIGMPKSAPA